MCRILSTYGKWDLETLQLALREFGSLTKNGVVPKGIQPGHEDGWGFVGYNMSGEINFIEKDINSAFNNEKYSSVIQNINTEKTFLLVGHLRKATIGRNVMENTQPFSESNFSFCHNGTIKEFKKFELGEKHSLMLKGTTDSEWIFHYLIQENEKQNESLAKTIADFIQKNKMLDYTGFNTLFSDGKKLIATREGNEKKIPETLGNLCEYYYTLFVGTSPENKAKIICSQILPLPGFLWKEIPNHSLVEIDLVTGTEEIGTV